MMALAVTVDGALGVALLAAAPVLALLAGWWAWRTAQVRHAAARAGITALRAALVLVAAALLADPTLSWTAERLPLLRIVRPGGPSADLADAPGGTTRREALDAALREARRLGLDRHYRIADPGDSSEASAAQATLVLSAGGVAAPEAGTGGRTVILEPPRDTAVPDVSVLDVDVPSAAAAGVPVEVLATLRARGAAGRRVVVTMSDGARVAASAARDVSEPDETFTVSLGAVLQAVGWTRLTFEAAGVTGEVALDDNRMERWIDLEERTRRVLYVESTPTWEGKFVRQALERDATLRVDYATSVSRDAVVEVRASEAAPSAQAPKAPSGSGPASLATILGDEKRLFGYDAVLLGPVDAAAIGSRDAERLVRFVDARGGGLVLLGGNAYAGSILAAKGPVAGMLPAQLPAASLARSGGRRPAADGAGDASGASGTIVLAPADGFATHPAFASLGPDPAAILAKLQRLDAGCVRLGALAAGAQVLAVDGAAAARTPLVVSHRLGAGRVTLVAPADTWRLSVGATAELEDVAARFWTGLVGWTASGATDRIAVRAEPTVAVAGQRARIVLEARAADWTPAASIRVDGRAEPEVPATEEDTDTGVDLAFVPDLAEPGRYVAAATLPAAGTWIVRVTVGDGDAAVARVEVVDGAGPDRPDPAAEAARETYMKDTGGAVVRDGDAATLVEALGSPSPSMISTAWRPAGGIWWAFALPLLFAAESLVRRWCGADG